MNKQEIEQNLIFLFTRGSQAYGTNIASSDEDIGGICLPSKRVIYSLEKFEQDDSGWFDIKGEPIDKTVYNIVKAFQLCSENNPNMLDFLYAPEHTIKMSTPIWEKVMAIRDEFLCIKAKWAYQGYAVSQLNRIKTHRSYLLNPPKGKPDRTAFGLSEKSIFPETQIEVLAKLSSEYVSEGRQDSFYSEITKLFDAEGSLIFKKYIDPEYYSFAIADFKKRQKEFLRMISSVSQHFLKDEYKDMAGRELAYIATLNDWESYQRWAKNRNVKRAEMEAKTGFDCYSYDTEFLTDLGWLLFDDIDESVKLATMNPLNNRMEFHKYIERFDGVYNGNLYNFTGTHTDILVTANHNMWVRDVERNNNIAHDWKFSEASNLHGTFDITTQIEPKITTQLPIDAFLDKNLDIELHDYLRLMGWYLSDGTCNFRNGKVKCICISQSKPQSRLTQTFTKMIKNGKVSVKKYTYPAREHQNFPESKWILPQDISKALHLDCGHGALGKRIPRWVFLLTKRNMDILLKSMLQGDGTKRLHADNTFVYYSVSKSLASDIQELAFTCGYESSLWGPYKMTSGFKSDNSMYQVHINKDAPSTKRMQCWSNIIKIPVVNHRIVCFTVPNHILITRRNGRIAIQGNCKHAMHLVRLLRMSIEILEGKGVNVDRTNIDREHLMDIRNGVFSFDQILEESNELNTKADELYKTCILPKLPNKEKIDKLLIAILDTHLMFS